MTKKYKIYKFDEGVLNKNDVVIEVKVSLTAERLAQKCRKLKKEYQETLSKLMKELNKDNSDVEFNNFFQDEFGFFTGELIS